jgi:ATP-dependent Lon protease
MFFKHKHLLEELRSGGARGTGEILSMKTLAEASGVRAIWAPDEDLTAGWMDCWMKLRVTPEDRGEAPFEATVMTRIHTMKFQGSHVPVWYDPEDQSRVVVDYEADVERIKAYQREADSAQQDYARLAHRYDQRPGLAWTPLCGELLPVETTFRRRGTGAVTVTGPGGELLREPAAAAVSLVRGGAGRYLPELRDGWFAEHDVLVQQPYGRAPAGAGQKDSAAVGLAIVAALVSGLSGRLVRTDVALSGAVGADGALVPVSGLKAKVSAAKRGYAGRLVVPAAGEADGQAMAQGIEVVSVSTVDDALRAALARHRLKGYEPLA